MHEAIQLILPPLPYPERDAEEMPTRIIKGGY